MGAIFVLTVTEILLSIIWTFLKLRVKRSTFWYCRVDLEAQIDNFAFFDLEAALALASGEASCIFILMLKIVFLKRKKEIVYLETVPFPSPQSQR